MCACADTVPVGVHNRTAEKGLKTIAIAGPKGGCGKSTITTLLAVRATSETGKVAMIDLNEDQGTHTEWWTLRGRPVNPYLYDGEGTLDQLMNALADDGWTYTFIDCPPYEQDLIEMAVIVADAVLIPVKAAYFDTSAIDSIVGMCHRRRKPFAFVLNEHDDRKVYANANAIALAMLEGRGTVLSRPISAHPKHRVSQIDGKTGAEIDKAIAAEVDELWDSVKSLAGGNHG